MAEQLEAILSQGLDALSLPYTDDTLRRFRLFYTLLSERRQQMNLTAISGEEDVARLHMLDCAAILPQVAFAGKRVLDVGSGAGFPGLVLKLLDPTMEVTLLDSLGKRVDWLQAVCRTLDLPDVVCRKGRAEELGRDPVYREQYDGAVSRALASMPVLAELCLPFVKPGGLFLAMKSNKTDEEIDAARPVIGTLGGEPPFVMDYRLPGEDGYRRIVTVYKRGATPRTYPRKWSKIKEAKFVPPAEETN